jgi:GT2 family glycosyltransferase
MPLREKWASMNKKVYIIVLNWNGWPDTLECLETIFRIVYQNYQVIVCDNNSQDGSLDYIKAWADGKLDVAVPITHPLRYLSFPPVSKPLPYVTYGREQAESGAVTERDSTPLVLIQTGANLGFAGGNNVGIRYAMARNDFEYIWLLNNDTVIKPDALSNLVLKMQSDTSIGICGSTLMFYDKPHLIQALGGGNYNKWLGTTHHVGALRNINKSIDSPDVFFPMFYVMGASMLVSKKFITDIGFMCEEYFLYYEEVDWALRARGKYSLAYESNSLVFHKEGSSVGSSSNPGKKSKSLIADYYGLRSRLLITKKFFPSLTLIVRTAFLAVIVHRVLRGQWDRLRLVIKIMTEM